MKRLITASFSLLLSQTIGQTCVSNAFSTFESGQLKMNTNSKGNIGTSLEFPKRTQKQIDQGEKGKFLVFDGGILLVKLENNVISKSESSYSTNNSFQFTPGPIDLKTGEVDWQTCEEFDRIWTIDRVIVDNFIILAKNSYTFPIPTISIPDEILQWPAKGNKLYTKVPIRDDLAPYYDFNGNGIYDPEYGDHPIFKGDQAQFTVMNDLYNQKFRTDNVLGIEMHVMVYNYKYTHPLNAKNIIYYDVKVNKKTRLDIDSFIFSLFFDSDIGNPNDDLLGCHPASNSAFSYNGDTFDDPYFQHTESYGINPPIFVSSLIRPKMTSWVPFINGAGSPLSNPSGINSYLVADSMRYLFEGNPSNPDDTSTMKLSRINSRDWRYRLNTDLTKLMYNQPKNYEFVLYAHQFHNYVSSPNIYDSVLKPLDSLKHYNPTKNCNISFSASISPSTDKQRNGKIQLTNIIAAKPFLAKWSSLETTEILNNKDSGKYRVVIIDANNCMKDSTFYIPLILKGTGGINQAPIDNITIFPNPIENHLTIKNPNQLKIENIYIYDVLGKLIYQTTINSRNETSELGLKTLSKGNYHMSINTEHGMKNFKITK